MVRLLLYLFDLVVVVVLGWVLNRVFQQLFGSARMRTARRRDVPPPGSATRIVPGETARDPVCGMFVSTEVSHRLTLGTKTLHFCSRECRDRYRENSTHD